MNGRVLGVVSGIPFPEALLCISIERMELIYRKKGGGRASITFCSDKHPKVKSIYFEWQEKLGCSSM